MNPQDNQDQTNSSGLLHDANFPSGIIKPRMLAADTTQAVGDLYHVNDLGIFERLPLGTSGQILTATNGLPSWETPAATVDIYGWTLTTATLTYSAIDGHLYTVTSDIDLTAFVHVGDKMKFTNNSTTFYGFVHSISSTVIKLYGGTDYAVANSAITAVYYSHAKSPFGFPTDPTKWTETLTDTSDRSQATPSSGTYYNLGSLSIDIPIGIWRVSFSVSFQVNTTSAPVAFTALSTANNSASDTELLCIASASAAAALLNSFRQEKILTLAAKTTYYLIGAYSGTATSIGFIGSTWQPTLIKAVCAYL